jgi:glycosyltransferase involved in cell wall biosynthesis
MNAMVTILMPAYNVEKYIDQAIQSIINQSFTNWELLISDDGSEDGTQKKINEYVSKDYRIKSFPNAENMGYLRTCNKLFDLCKGEFITFQDADDYSMPLRLEEQLSAFQDDSDLGVCGTQIICVDKLGSKLKYIQKKELGYHGLLKNRAKVNPFCGATMMLRKVVLLDVGYYRGFFDRLAYQDHDWANLIIEKYKGINLNKVLYAYRQHGGSGSKQINIGKILSPLMVEKFTNQREQAGRDWLMSDVEKAKDYFEDLKVVYKSDTSQLYRDYASNFMYNNLFNKAIMASFSAVKLNPSKFINYRTLLYCLRKVVVSLVLK